MVKKSKNETVEKLALKVKKRKYTTEKGLETLWKSIEKINSLIVEIEKGLEMLWKLVEKINSLIVEIDIKKIDSNNFCACYRNDSWRVHNISCHDYNYSTWEDGQTFFCVKNGKLKLYSYNSRDNQSYQICENEFKNLLQIDFKNCVLCLEELLQKYNKLVLKKEKKIEVFINLVETF